MLSNRLRHPASIQSFWVAMTWIVIWNPLLVGCREAAVPEKTVLDPASALRQMRLAISKQDWQTAWDQADVVLQQHPDDPELLVKIATVAHEVGQPSRAADLLIDACRVEGHSDPARVRRSVVALIEVGRLYDALQWLEEVVAADPQQHASRRWLFDLYRSAGDLMAARPHGLMLVRQRQFDSKLLAALASDNQQSDDATAVKAMVERNPSDRRPLLKEAELMLAGGQQAEGIELLRSILQQYPQHPPSAARLCLALADAGEFDQSISLADSMTDSPVTRQPSYSIALGRCQLHNDKSCDAITRFADAARRNPDLIDAWQGVIESSQRCSSGGDGAQVVPVTEIENRVRLLQKLETEVDLFERTGGISRELAIAAAESLRDLGRWWEAEAWASLAMTMPADDSVPAETVRNQIVTLLRKDTPDQVISVDPALQWLGQ
ncbi:tetratricopeptide repeat protein [Stieleria tagensis]|uniref:tetratricopeptide repeat protein n=1 Tax=Stieleria tagensis TaxID=2956795 RepID=UPI00209AEE5F|nr:tetratricopeptide repeat protein [Stieleria tagensis]